jgi:hypothetical protein
LEYTLGFLSLLSNSPGLKEHRISAQRQALAVSGQAMTVVNPDKANTKKC